MQGGEPPDRDNDMEGDPRKVMVVYGRDGPAASGMFDFLERLGLEPQEWGELKAATRQRTPYVGDILDTALRIARAIVVLFTPDDEVRLHPELQRDNDPPYETDWTLQPRPNVLFEAGLAFGRKRDRTILVELGDLRGLSDLLGRHTIRLDGTHGRLHELAEELRSAGCDVKTARERWLDPSVFPMPMRVPATVGEARRDGVKPPATEGDPLSTLREILRRVDGPEVDDAVAVHLLAVLKEQTGPFRLSEVLDRVPDLRLGARARHLAHELKDAGLIAASPSPEREYVTAF